MLAPSNKLRRRQRRQSASKPFSSGGARASGALSAYDAPQSHASPPVTQRPIPRHAFEQNARGPAVHHAKEPSRVNDERAVDISVSAFEYAENIQTLNDPLVIQGIFAERLATLGFTNFTFLEFTPDPKAIERHIIDNRMPDEWSRRYVEQRYVAFDPVVLEVLSNTESFLWSEALSKRDADKRQRRIFHEASEFQLKEGVCIPIFGPRNYMAWVTLAGAAPDLSLRARMAAHMMSIYTHNRLVRLVRPKQPPVASLTDREADCLKWAAYGKSDWEIGEILKISEHTVHWHMENAKRKIGVATRMQAVVGAIAEGLIHI